MKKMKLIMSVVVVVILFACSKSENETETEPQLKITYNNLSGVWYIKSVIKSDGTIVNHNNVCTSKRDYIHINPNTSNNIFNFVYQADCVNINNVGCGAYFLDSDTKTIIGNSCSSPFEGVISQLTASKLQIDYSEAKNLMFLNEPFNCKGVILSRQ
ncbi:hypothetical protein D3C86_1293240 [compost metagenome]